MIDILEKVYNKEVSLDEAYDLIDEEIDKAWKLSEGLGEETIYIDKILGYSQQEWKADVFGVPLEDIARWRYEGWPQYCSKCGKPIFYDIQYIMYKHGKPKHIGCGVL